MYLAYSILLSLGFVVMLPLFLMRRQKYAAGFWQRMGHYLQFVHDGRPVIWLHCVSVGETNAARPLVDALLKELPAHRLVLSTTTRTGQELARKIFAGKAEAVFYFPFDWKFTVRRALGNYKPSLVLLMETEIWPRFIHEAKAAGAKVAIINGRLSARSARRYSWARPFVENVLGKIDLALMQTEGDAKRAAALGLRQDRTRVTGNVKFDLSLDGSDEAIRHSLDDRFDLSNSKADKAERRPVIVAASTHEPEERWTIEAFCSAAAGESSIKPRLIIAPRHPERFDQVARTIMQFRSDPACEWQEYTYARRSAPPAESDATADVIILDSIGELRAVYPLADIVFVGGSLIPHGGQSILEPAAAGRAIVTGFHTHNFEEVVRTFLGCGALVQLPDKTGEQIVDELFLAISDLLENAQERHTLGLNAAAVMKANRGATGRTVESIKKLSAEFR